MSSLWVELMGSEVRLLQGRYRTRAIIAGEGEPLLLLHGTGGHAENFSRNIAYYARHFRVCAFDMLWHGFSQTSPFDEEVLPSLIEHTLDVADTLGFERFHLEGQSMGGWVGVLLALRYPHRIRRLVLTTPMGYRLDPAQFPTVKVQDVLKLRDANLAVLRNPTIEAVRDRLTRIVHDPNCLTEEAIRVRHRIYNVPEINAVQQQLMISYLGGAAPRKHEFSDSDLQNISVPALLCWADHNPVPTIVGQHIASLIPECQFYCAKNTGHWAQYEDSAEHNRRVVAFLSASRSDRQEAAHE